MTRLAVLGSPIAHSLSPTIHLAAYRLLSLDWEYEAIEVDSGGLREFLNSCKSDWRGLSVTMPLKAEAITVCDEVDALAKQVGGANTITWKDHLTRAHNTDVSGFLSALVNARATSSKSVAILGGGATARAAVAAVGSFAERITVYLRNPKRESELNLALGLSSAKLDFAPWAEVIDGLTSSLVVSTTPKGATDSL
ncbi:MAG TPA: hypothetical protein VMV52_04340, partial [Candidatus Nanopelagicaceae bacterium]|nr:hypothetical protein [Candidatus Nanopelagicaceae bacterium]